jgi:hypothetical protein
MFRPTGVDHTDFFRWVLKLLNYDALGDHLCTCTTHSGSKKAHDWEMTAAGPVPLVLDLRIAHEHFGRMNEI